MPFHMYDGACQKESLICQYSDSSQSTFLPVHMFLHSIIVANDEEMTADRMTISGVTIFISSLLEKATLYKSDGESNMPIILSIQSAGRSVNAISYPEKASAYSACSSSLALLASLSAR
eukprot:scaffold5229_cov66-Skeletonema_marinoi.AAC.1